ncbi:mycofactocin biosynthesis peptidyl-dipeptidase MftE [Nocardioides jiangxiensis]|uniref:Mycofactocin biosynthesis peptidyl-dipeptidase MftE n=1 Tax=Nocardioides jiangxiensis TaxID=3064524 RepID=A0ABT9B0W9_9ACTN|nr:mycofactocin biosynthesis peptidyl-dipeptidase MftE [Nocardioides sp. WY-20]MDO7868479.1 mycofactocin biosynthesis peptidyl-dipeptidase MftE [Nocardioides sp. WY-20]
MELALATWPELGERVDVVVLPTGSCEQHGPHLPFATDAAIATSVAGRAVQRLRAAGVHAVAAPALPYGASGEHEHFPGTVDIGHEALHSVLLELGRSISRWADRLVVVNGHGGNAPTVAAAVGRLRHEGRDAGWVPCEIVWGDAHAGRTETSMMAAIAPAVVREDRAEAGATEPVEVLMPRLRTGGVRAVSPNGVLGDPAGASAAEGELLLAGLVDATVEAVLQGRPDVTGRLRVPVSA